MNGSLMLRAEKVAPWVVSVQTSQAVLTDVWKCSYM